MDNYYRILFYDSDVYGVAFTLKEGDLFFLPDSGRVEGWNTLELELREGVFTDYLSSNLGCRMYSDKLRELLDKNSSSHDKPQWLPVIVHNGNERRNYSILHFSAPLDVIKHS